MQNYDTSQYAFMTQAQKNAFNSKNTNSGKQQAVNADTEVYNAAQAKLQGIGAQLAGVNAEAQAIPIQIQQEFAGRGATRAGTAPIESARLRDNALKALPLQAQAMAAQAEAAAALGKVQLSQNILQQAEKQLETLYQIHQEDNQRKYEYQAKVFDTVSKYVDKQQSALLEQRQQEAQNQFLLQRDAIQQAQQEDLINLRGKVDIAVKTAVPGKAPVGGSGINPAGGSPAVTKEQTQKNESLTLAEELLKDDAVGKKAAVGASLQKLIPFGLTAGLQPERAAFEARVNTLKASLTFENLSLLKGAMSDKDLLFLTSIGSSLDTGMSEKEFNRELGRIITKLEDSGAQATNSNSGFDRAAAKAAGYSDAEIDAYLSKK
jgi:hypothetical protein